MFTHIMIDCETLSNAGDAALLQIAAATFDPDTGAVGKCFNAFIKDSTGTIDVDTVAWWLRQDAAKTIGAALDNHADLMSEAEAVQLLAQWLDGRGCVAGGPVEALWCHGGIDFTWIKSALRRHGWPPFVWSYKVERDTRTLYAVAPGGMPVVPEDPARKHDARYDVERQIKSCVGALLALRAQVAAAEWAASAGTPYDDSPVEGGYRGDTPPWVGYPYADPVGPTGTSGYADPPPVWSNAEASVEGDANPSPRPSREYSVG